MLFVVLCPGTPERLFLWPCSLAVPVLARWVYFFSGSMSRNSRRLSSGSGFKASQKTGQRLKVSSDRLGEAGNRTCGRLVLKMANLEIIY